jgi:hypothetical protein
MSRRSLIVALCGLLGGCQPALSAPASGSGETPAARQFAAWLKAFNSGDREVLLAFHRQHFPYQVASRDVAGIDRELGLSGATGGFDVRKTEQSTATSFTAVLKERRSPQHARASLEVDAAEPHRVTHFEIGLIPTPEDLLTPEDKAAARLDPDRRRRLFEGIARELRAHYVFPKVAEEMIIAMNGHAARGEYDQIGTGRDLADALTRDLRGVSHDLHLAVMFGPRRPPAGVIPPDRQRRDGDVIGPVERLPDNIARLRIDGFPPPEEVRKAIARAMTEVADADALLIDLRQNHGGSPDTVALVASYLFDKPVHLNDMFRRDDGSTHQSWTQAHVAGRRFGGRKPVYVLTSKETFSGGEELAYDLQALRRARLVGETTGGGANPVELHVLEAGFAIGVPWGRPINPVTRTNWERVGVIPDVPIRADAAVETAYLLARKDLGRPTSSAARSPSPSPAQ